MLNIVTGMAGEGAAVLIRSCEVLEGIQTVLERRKAKHGASICNGPGKVAQALAIDGGFNGHPLFESGGLELRDGAQPVSIERTARIGIGYAKEADKSAPLRFVGRW
jgi:DNA-3-methyladenine glycosylase